MEGIVMTNSDIEEQRAIAYEDGRSSGYEDALCDVATFIKSMKFLDGIHKTLILRHIRDLGIDNV